MQDESAARIDEEVYSLPVDLAAIGGWALVTLVITMAPSAWNSPLRFMFGIPFLFFLPGYAFVAALFPEAGSQPNGETGSDTRWMKRINGMDGPTRVILSFGLSIVLTPLIALTLALTPWGMGLASLAVGLAGMTIGLAAVASIRRRTIPPERRFSVPYREWVAATRNADRRTQVISALLVVCLLCAIIGVGYAVVAVGESEQTTALYLLPAENEPTTDEYPTTFTAGEEQPLRLGIENAERETTTYTIIIEIQRVSDDDDMGVLEHEELDRSQTTVEAGETRTYDHAITPTMVGEDLRLIYFLYDEEPPDEPTTENAYRHSHLWINVEGSQTTETNRTSEPPHL